MKQDVYYLSPVLRAVVHDCKYKPNWTMWLDFDIAEDGAGGWAFNIVSRTEDSLKPGETIRVRHSFLVPAASYNHDTWVAWVFERIRDVETHEAGEFFQYRGERVFAPHHGNGENPYLVWHHGTEEARAKRAGED